MNVQNMGLPQSTYELKEIDWNNSTVECESLEHHPISTPKLNQVPITDTSVIATSTSKMLSKILQKVSIRCKKRTTQLPIIQINLSHSKTLGSSNIQKKDFKKKRKKDFKMSNLSQAQAHTSSLGQNARIDILALTYNVNSAIDLHNQRDNYLNDLDWDRPPPDKLCIQRKCLSGHTHSYMVTLADHFLHWLDWDRPPPIHHFIMPHETANQLYPISSHPHNSKTSLYPVRYPIIPNQLTSIQFDTHLLYSLSTECFNQLPSNLLHQSVINLTIDRL